MRPNVEIELEIPKSIEDVISGCAIYCEPACCGEHAFQLFPENMWVSDLTPGQIAKTKQDIDELIEQLTRLGPKAGLKWFSGDDPNGPRAWLEDVRECFIEATSPPATQPDGSPVFRHATINGRVLTASEKHNGDLFPPEPLESGRIEVFLADGPSTNLITLSVNRLNPGEEALAELRFPLPKRIHPCLTVGGTLDLGPYGGGKEVHATIMELLA